MAAELLSVQVDLDTVVGSLSSVPHPVCAKLHTIGMFNFTLLYLCKLHPVHISTLHYSNDNIVALACTHWRAFLFEFLVLFGELARGKLSWCSLYWIVINGIMYM